MKQLSAQIEILDRADLDQIHQATLDVLASTGCRMPHSRVLGLMRDAGAHVDPSAKIVRFPEAVIQKAIEWHATRQKDTSTIPLPVRNGQFMIYPASQANMVDYQATARRPGTTEDILKGIVLCNELPFIASVSPVVTPADTPATLSDLHSHYLCMLYSRKPFSTFVLSPESARQIIRMWEITQDEPACRKDKTQFTYLLNPNGALSYEVFSLEIALIFAKANFGITLVPMAMAGLDAPITLAGTLVMQNAYNLAALVLCWLLGVKANWGGGAHTADMRHLLCSFGSPNQAILAVAATQLGHYYGIEVGVNSALTDACMPDFQSGFEKGMTATVALMAGAEGLGVQGIVGADQGFSLEQLVIDNEWASAMNHFFTLGCEVSAETLAVDLIKKVGIGGTYISEEHTVRHMRETYWKATIFNQKSWHAWNQDGAKEAYQCAHERVQEILAAHYPPHSVLSQPAINELDNLMAAAREHPEAFEL